MINNLFNKSIFFKIYIYVINQNTWSYQFTEANPKNPLLCFKTMNTMDWPTWGFGLGTKQIESERSHKSQYIISKLKTKHMFWHMNMGPFFTSPFLLLSQQLISLSLSLSLFHYSQPPTIFILHFPLYFIISRPLLN